MDLDKQKQKELDYINNTLNNASFVDMVDRDDVSIKSVLNNNPKEEQSTYRNKPLGFKYEITERGHSVTPKEIQEKIVNFENAKVKAEQEKIAPNASMNYENRKQLDEMKTDVEDYFKLIEGIKDGLKRVNEHPSLSDSQKRATIMGMKEDIESGFSKDGCIKMKTLKSLSRDVEYKLSIAQELDDIRIKEVEPETPKNNGISRKNKNRF